MTQNNINTRNPVVQVVSTSTSAVVTCNTTIPVDDTIPQNTEGTEVLTLAITPMKTTNLLHIFFQGIANNNGTSNTVQVALFQDATANALTVIKGIEENPGAQLAGGPISLLYIMAAGTTSATTFKIRVGPDTSTCYINADSAGTRLFGGVAATNLTITEYAN